MKVLHDVEKDIADLYGALWSTYDDRQFWESVELFARRFEANGFDLSWFKGRRCLDAGCGGGRYSIAMAQLGATQVIGCDISITGLADARRRAANLPNVVFEEASVLDLPYSEDSFDFVCCSGVLHHTTHPEKGLRELCRVLRPGGKFYLLVYATGGIRWPTMMAIRLICRDIGFEAIGRAIALAGLPANKRRIFLDDLFVPVIDFYTWDRLRRMLEANSLTEINRWKRGHMDHEEGLASLRDDLESLAKIFEVGANSQEEPCRDHRERFGLAFGWCNSAIATVRVYEREVDLGLMTAQQARKAIIGQGNHRLVATKRLSK